LKIFITALLVALIAISEAVQAVPLPEGRSIFGPIPVTQLDRITEIRFERTSNAFTAILVTFQYCSQACSNSPEHEANWHWYGESRFPGGGIADATLGSFKMLPGAVVATHVRLLTDVIGGSVDLRAAPTIQVRGTNR
jgi:hypothetical protein